MDTRDSCIESLVGPIANVLDGFMDYLAAACNCNEGPLRLVVNIVLTGLTDCHVGNTTKLFA